MKKLISLLMLVVLGIGILSSSQQVETQELGYAERTIKALENTVGEWKKEKDQLDEKMEQFDGQLGTMEQNIVELKKQVDKKADKEEQESDSKQQLESNSDSKQQAEVKQVTAENSSEQSIEKKEEVSPTPQSLIGKMVKPSYPKDAHNLGVEGDVKLAVSVKSSGKVEEIKILESDDERFNNTVRLTIKHAWEFESHPADYQLTFITKFRDGTTQIEDLALAKVVEQKIKNNRGTKSKWISKESITTETAADHTMVMKRYKGESGVVTGRPDIIYENILCGTVPIGMGKFRTGFGGEIRNNSGIDNPPLALITYDYKGKVIGEYGFAGPSSGEVDYFTLLEVSKGSSFEITINPGYEIPRVSTFPELAEYLH